MSRLAKLPVEIAAGVQVDLTSDSVVVKGSKGQLQMNQHPLVQIKQTDGQLTFDAKDTSKQSRAMSGTIRALVDNMVKGVQAGFEKKLQLVGVGYRAQLKGQTLNLTLGFSHPVDYALPSGITAEVPSQTEVVIKGIDKQLVGQVAAEIRDFRRPEPYKGKGIRYADEIVRRKEAKKK